MTKFAQQHLTQAGSRDFNPNICMFREDWVNCGLLAYCGYPKCTQWVEIVNGVPIGCVVFIANNPTGDTPYDKN